MGRGERVKNFYVKETFLFFQPWDEVDGHDGHYKEANGLII